MRTVLKVWILASVGLVSVTAGCRSDHDDGHDHSKMSSAIAAISVTR